MDIVVSVIVVTLVLAGLAFFLNRDMPHERRDNVIHKVISEKDGRKSLTVGDGVRFGFGFGLGMFLWVILITIGFTVFVGPLVARFLSELFSNPFVF